MTRTKWHFLCEERLLRVHLYSEQQLAHIQVHCYVSACNKRRQLVEVHRVTTHLCEMCHDCFDWQLVRSRVNCPSEQVTVTAAVRHFPSPRLEHFDSIKARADHPPYSGQGNLFAGGGQNCVCVHVWRWGGGGCRHSPQGSLILHRGFRLETQHCLVRGAVIKPLKDLRERSIKCDCEAVQ